jgi:hypothetical protein
MIPLLRLYLVTVVATNLATGDSQEHKTANPQIRWKSCQATSPMPLTLGGMMNNDTYTKPEQGWTCFHCGETFHKLGCAEEHFGKIPERTPTCELRKEDGGLEGAFRRLEAEYLDLLMRFQLSDETVGHAMSSIMSSLRITDNFLKEHTKHLKTIKVDPLEPFGELLNDQTNQTRKARTR